MTAHRRVIAGLAAAALLCLSASAGAQLNNEDLVCPDAAPEIGPTEYLRALSLSLRGEIPTMEEYEAIQASGEVPEALVDEWLASPAFADQVVRHHRALLWNNVTNINLMSASFSMRRDYPALTYWRSNTAIRYRGVQMGCLDEPAAFDADGVIQTKPVGEGMLEGWVWVSPYWAPETEIKVCAFDAQDVLYGSSGVFCGTNAGRDDASCGCGPDLRWCRYGSSHLPVTQALGTDVDLRVAAMILDDAPYTELFSAQRGFVNGPLVHFLKHQTEVFANIRFDPLPIETMALPDLEWSDVDTWVEVPLDIAHAGVLTTPAYLLRFQTNRARANRFYDAFLCQPFNAPDGGIPITSDGGLPHPDLQERAGCKYCHALLEPAASHWGRWAPGGAGYLDPFEFPRERQDCTNCALYGTQCTDVCNRFYLTDALSVEEDAYLGQLEAYVFRREEHEMNVEAGPELLVNKTVVDGRLPRCVATRTATWLLGRDAQEDEAAWIEELAEGFVMSGFSYRELVKRVVTHETYRRLR